MHSISFLRRFLQNVQIWMIWTGFSSFVCKCVYKPYWTNTLSLTWCTLTNFWPLLHLIVDLNLHSWGVRCLNRWIVSLVCSFVLISLHSGEGKCLQVYIHCTQTEEPVQRIQHSGPSSQTNTITSITFTVCFSLQFISKYANVNSYQLYLFMKYNEKLIDLTSNWMKLTAFLVNLSDEFYRCTELVIVVFSVEK